MCIFLCLILLMYFKNDNTYYNHWNEEFNTWLKYRDRESSSGHGSSIYNTKNTLKTLNNVIDKYNIKIILDLPCGDMNWISKLDLSKIKYTGMDISNDLILYNKNKYKNLNFKKHDIIVSPIKQQYDLILCRDLLFHLSIDEVKSCINNMKKSNSTYILTTTFPKSNKNSELSSLSFAEINLQKDPFNFPNPTELFPEVEKGKYLGLWKLNDIKIL